MYSQIANVAQNAAQVQQAKLSEAMQQQGTVQKNLEQAKKVKRSADDESSSAEVKDEGRNGTQYGPDGKKRDRKKDSGDEEENGDGGKDTGIRESYLGQHINITR